MISAVCVRWIAGDAVAGEAAVGLPTYRTGATCTTQHSPQSLLLCARHSRASAHAQLQEHYPEHRAWPTSCEIRRHGACIYADFGSQKGKAT